MTMKWPWVSRRDYDAQSKALREVMGVRDTLYDSVTALENEKMELEKRAMQNYNRMVGRKKERDQARKEVNELLAERDEAVADRKKVAEQLAWHMQYELEATLSTSTQGVHQTPCMRFIIREKGDKKILCMSDVDGEPDVKAALATLQKIECGRMVVKQLRKEGADGGQDTARDDGE